MTTTEQAVALAPKRRGRKPSPCTARARELDQLAHDLERDARRARRAAAALRGKEPAR